jgi:hypothetical protein
MPAELHIYKIFVRCCTYFAFVSVCKYNFVVSFAVYTTLSWLIMVDRRELDMQCFIERCHHFSVSGQLPTGWYPCHLSHLG